MTEQLSEKEQRLEGELSKVQQQLAHARAELQSAEEDHGRLRKRQATAQALDKICNHLADLSQLEPLEKRSPFDDAPFGDENQINQYYAGYIERIKRQVGDYRRQLSNTESRVNAAREATAKIRKQVDAVSAELERIRPTVRMRTITRVGSDGIERSFTVVYRRESLMPWSESVADTRRFERILARTLVLILLLCLIMPFIPIPEFERPQVVEVSERMAKLINERPPPPPPPPKVSEKKPAEELKKKLTPREKAPEPKTEVAKAAREKAKQSGFLAFQDSFADLMSNSVEEKLGKQSSLTTGGEKARQTERSLITASAGQGSGGINTASLSRDVAGTGLSGRGTSRVTTTIGSGFGDAQRPLADSVRGSRTDEEIQLVFDRNKSALYAIYQRALREDPTLKGKIVLKITIAPDGSVVASSVSSSDLGNKELEGKIAARVKLFNFGAKEVDQITITYPIDFLPA